MGEETEMEDTSDELREVHLVAKSKSEQAKVLVHELDKIDEDVTSLEIEISSLRKTRSIVERNLADLFKE